MFTRGHRLDVHTLPVLADNLVHLLACAHEAAVVDPSDAAPVLRALEERHLRLRTVLLTHCHADHTIGAAFAPGPFSPPRRRGEAGPPASGQETRDRDR